MTKEEKQVIAIEVHKYFISGRIDADWFSRHLKRDIEMPEDGFEPRKMSVIKIDEDSIRKLRADLYGFSGSAKVLFVDKASTVGPSANVYFSGHAFIITSDERILARTCC